MTIKELLLRTKVYIEETEQVLENEYGFSDDIENKIALDDMPSVYLDIVSILASDKYQRLDDPIS